MKSSLHSLIHLLPSLLNHLRLSSPEFDQFSTTTFSNDIFLSLYKPSARTTQKTTLSIVEKACLLIRCLTTDVQFLRAYALEGMCLPSRCLAMGLYHTILLLFQSGFTFVLKFPQQIIIPRMLRSWDVRQVPPAGKWSKTWIRFHLWADIWLDSEKHKLSYTYCFRSQDSSVGIATGYGLDGPGSIPRSGRYFISPQRPERLWGLPNLQYNVYRRLFRPGGEAAWAWGWLPTSI
jgi:hypothetical protein